MIPREDGVKICTPANRPWRSRCIYRGYAGHVADPVRCGVAVGRVEEQLIVYARWKVLGGRVKVTALCCRNAVALLSNRHQFDSNLLTPIHPDAILESGTVHPGLCAGAPTPVEPPGVNGLYFVL